MKKGRNKSVLHSGLENPKMNKNHSSYQSLFRMYGQIPSGYWNLEGWKGYVDVRDLCNTYIENGKKLPNITDPAGTGLQGDGLRQDPMTTELVGAEVGNPDYNNAEDLQSTGDNSINRLLGLDNINKEGDGDAWANVYQDIVGDMVSNEKSTNRHINHIKRGIWK